MSSRVPPIARIRLARAPFRLMLLPALFVALGAALEAVAVFGPVASLTPAWIALVAGGALFALLGLVIAIWLLGVRLDVEEAAIRVHWPGGERLHPLVPGPVTRVRLRGDNASSLRSRTGLLGWTVGRARLRGEETIHVIRLARTPTAILVPTEGGRLAIAAASEAQLIEALSRAARARQRLEELAQPLPRRDVEVAPPAPAPSAAEVAPEVAPEPEPHFLTGIERTELEERLAREPESATVLPAAHGAVAAPPTDATTVAPAAKPPIAEPAPGRWRRGRPAVRIGRPRPSAAFVLLPLIGAGGLWALATLGGRLPEPGTDLARLTALGLVLAGPATSVGAIMARAWWPRLVGVVVTSGLASAVFVGRALLGQ